MTNSPRINIVIACDYEYLPHAATMLSSLVKNNTRLMTVFLLHKDLNTSEINKLSELIKPYKGHLYPIKIDDSELLDLKITHHFNESIFYRLLIPDVLPSSINKVLYLDSDLIVRKSLDELWNVDLTDNYLAAVKNKINMNRKIKLGLSIKANYFNSGVMLINVTKWRKDKLHQKVIEFLRNNPEVIEYPDQDGLNAVLNGNWLELPLKWNLQSDYYLPEGAMVRYADLLEDSCIIHFTGNKTKPWQDQRKQHPYYEDYYFYKSLTPWGKYEERKSVKTNIKRRLNDLLKFLIRVIGKFSFTYRINHYIGIIHNEINREYIKKYSKITIPSSSIISENFTMFPDRKIVNGPFKGLHYPRIESIGSTITPKLLGTYEIELSEIIEKSLQLNYEVLIDIGCAEGYYACGFAKRMKNINVYAFDNNPNARKLCRLMAEENQISERIEINSIFTMRTISQIPVKKHGLVICDCEGAEEYIFYNDGENWNKLIDHFDVLMEIHDVFRPGISGYIYNLFENSHHIQIVYSLNDAIRPKLIKCDFLEGMTYDEKVKLMAEKRKGLMIWFYMTRKFKGY